MNFILVPQLFTFGGRDISQISDAFPKHVPQRAILMLLDKNHRNFLMWSVLLSAVDWWKLQIMPVDLLSTFTVVGIDLERKSE